MLLHIIIQLRSDFVLSFFATAHLLIILWLKKLVLYILFDSYLLDHRAQPSTDTTAFEAGDTNYTTQFDCTEVEMTHNPAYGPVTTASSLKKVEPQYEEVAPPTGGWTH